MTPAELVAELKRRGVDISVATINRWVTKGLVPTPPRGSLGRGKGRWTDWPPEAVAWIYATQKLRTAAKLRDEDLQNVIKLVHNLWVVEYLWGGVTGKGARVFPVWGIPEDQRALGLKVLPPNMADRAYQWVSLYVMQVYNWPRGARVRVSWYRHDDGHWELVAEGGGKKVSLRTPWTEAFYSVP